MRQLLSYRFTLSFLGSLVFLLVFSGCATSTSGSSSSPQGNNGNTPTSPTQQATKPPLTNLSDYCNLVSLAEVSHITGQNITHLTPIPNDERHEVACGYGADIQTSGGAVIIFVVSSDSGQAQTVFAAYKQQAQSKGATVVGLSGIGDQAFSTTQNGVNSVVALKGTVVFLVGGTTPHPLPLTIDQPLAQLVASRL